MKYSELDKIRSSITISLGVKNRLRKVKGSMSYEDYISYLLRLKNQITQNENHIEIQQFERVSAIYSFENFKIIFLYNKCNHSLNHIFDIQIKTIRKEGMLVSMNDFLKHLSADSANIKATYELYFHLLEEAIKRDVDSLFKHKGRFEDYFLWQEEFKKLNLSQKSFEEDIMEKLNDYQNKIGAFE